MRAGAGWRGSLAGAVILILCLTAAGATDARADGRHAAFVIDANTGRVLHSADADDPRFPASLTKMMTLYLVFEQLEAGRIEPSTPIRISAQAAAVPPSKLDLDPGDTIPLSAAIRALVTKSANDIAVAIAEHIAGSEAAFARAMTAKARQLGMRQTVFRNAHGLPDPEQVTTMAAEPIEHHHDHEHGGTAIDPVCGMTVTADDTSRPFEHEGETYYFCCPGCRAAFEKDPSAYTTVRG